MPLLLDSGILYALADTDDAWHRRARSLITETEESLLAPVTVLPEVAYLLRSRLGAAAEATFVESLAAGELAVEPLTPPDLRRGADLLAQYPDIGFVDATVVAMAERLGLRSVATTDRRHFAQIRPANCDAFALLP